MTGMTALECLKTLLGPSALMCLEDLTAADWDYLRAMAEAKTLRETLTREHYERQRTA